MNSGRDDLYVQYGCGPGEVPVDWLNFDASPTLRLSRLPIVGAILTANEVQFDRRAKYGDICRGLTLPDNSCAGVYCSHVLEHLSLSDLRSALRETYRLTARDGRFRVVVPDLAVLIDNYSKSSSPIRAMVFMEQSFLGVHQRKKGGIARLRATFGNSNHLWMWDFESLSLELEDAGFRSIRKAEFGDSSDTRFDAVEASDRWTGSLGIECLK